MKQKAKAIKSLQGETCDWQKREGEHAASALSTLINEQTGRQRVLYSQEWERHERLAEVLMSASPEARNLIQAMGAIKLSEVALGNQSRIGISNNAFDHQLNTMDNTHTLADRLSFRVPPYDLTWHNFQPYDRWGTAARGPSVDIKGRMTLDLRETYVDRPIAYGGWMRNAAGIGTWFKPKSTSTYVRVAPLCFYEYYWKNDSSLQVAHNSGNISILIQRYIGPGQFETILDNRTALWRDGTGWYETHQGDDSGSLVSSNYFWASSKDWYLIWVWCDSAIDFATKTTFGSSRASNNLDARLRWLVFEQWA